MGIHYRLNPETRQLEEIPPEKPKEKHHAVITDDIPEGIQSMVTKKWYTSKARLRQEYKELGFIEKGNDEDNRPPDPKHDDAYDEELEAEVTRSYFSVRDGMAELSDIDRHRCGQVNRNLDRYNFDRRERDDEGNILE